LKITSLSIENFGIISNESFNFEDGVFVFSGDNGEGKSTVLKALSLLLFNRVPGKMSDYIQWGKEEASVGCIFSHNGSEYKTLMKIGSSGTERLLKNTSTNEEITSTSAVNEKINEILDVKRAIASTTSFEHEIDLITTSPSERREYLKKVYDLSFKTEKEKIESDIEKAKTSSTSLSSEITTLKSLEFDLQQLERPPFPKSSYEEKVNYTSFLREAIKDQESELSDDKKKLKEIENKKSRKNLKEEEKNDLLKEIESTESKIEAQTQKIDNLHYVDVSGIEQKYTEKRQKIITRISSLKEDIELSKNAIENRIPRDKELLQYTPETHEEIQNKVYSLKASLSNLEGKSKSLSDGLCPVCGTEFDSHDLSQFDHDIENLESELEVNTSKLADMNSKKKKFDDLTELEKEYSSRIKSFTESLKTAQDQEKELDKNEEEEISNKKKENKNLLTSAKEVLDLYKTSIDDKKKMISNIETEISKLESDIKEDRLLRNNIELIEEQITKMTANLRELEDDIKSYDKVISLNEEKKKINEAIESKKQKRDEKLIELQNSLEDTENNLSSYKLALKILTKDFPSFVLSRLIDNLQSYTNEFLQQVYPKYTLSFEESKSTLSVLYNGVDVKLASGFEKQVFSFAYKYALGKIQNYNILFLDEVDSAASEENSKLFYDTLAKMKDFFSQIFIITHKQDTKELLSSDHGAIVYNILGGKVEKL